MKETALNNEERVEGRPYEKEIGLMHTTEPRRVYFNPMQRDAVAVSAKDTVVVAGRGTGKGLLQAAFLLRAVQSMPRCTIGLIAPNIVRAKTNIVPSMLSHIEDWGYKEGLHFVVGSRPARKLEWQKPLYTPYSYDNIISFYNGSIIQIVSQDRKGTSNSKSFDFLSIDEAKYIKYDQLKDETFQANRGNGRFYGNCPWHHGMIITSDLSLSKKGSWFMHYEEESTPDLCQLIRETGLKIEENKNKILDGSAKSYLCMYNNTLRRYLNEMRKKAVYYRTFSSLENLAVLGEEFIRKQKRDLPPLVFQTSILCKPVQFVKDGFYSSMNETHLYKESDLGLLDGLPYSKTAARSDALNDADYRADLPLCVAFDYNANINWLVVGQIDEEAGRLYCINSFFVKYERKLPELVDDFCAYYGRVKNRDIVFYFDSTALGSNYAVNTDDFKTVIIRRFEKHGFKVRPVYLGSPMNHQEKHLLINQGFAGRNRLTPAFNEEKNEALLISIRTAGVYNGKKDKRGEKLAETEEDKLEGRTDGSDAWDTLYIGSEKQPRGQSLYIPNSNSFY